MKVKILKWAIKSAIAAGLPQKLWGWLKPKFDKAVDKAKAKISAKVDAVLADEDEVEKVVGQ